MTGQGPRVRMLSYLLSAHHYGSATASPDSQAFGLSMHDKSSLAARAAVS